MTHPVSRQRTFPEVVVEHGYLIRAARLFTHARERGWALLHRSCPSPDEQARTDGFRKELQRLGADGSAPADGIWASFLDRFTDDALHKDPRRFLCWDVPRESMFMGNAPSVFKEFFHLRSQPNWLNRWKPALHESPLGAPARFPLLPSSSGNLIHHAYHLCRFEEASGFKPEAFELVVEFGGGYGSMCRLFHALGFRGRYVIFDFPHFSALQAFYLKGLKLPVRASLEAGPQPGIYLVSDAGGLQRATAGLTSGGALFLATWSLSEVPLPARAALLPRLNAFSAFLVGYAATFKGMDNQAYFAGWQAREDLGRVTWLDAPIQQMPGHRYLFGWTASAGTDQ